MSPFSSIHDWCCCCERAGSASALPRSFPASARTANRCRLFELIHGSPRMANSGLCHYSRVSHSHQSCLGTQKIPAPSAPASLLVTKKIPLWVLLCLLYSYKDRLELICECVRNYLHTWMEPLRLENSLKMCSALQFAHLNWKDH